MQYIEYGKENRDVIVLLHGGGLCWWNYREVAELLQSEYHVILPILNGHAGSDKDFSTIENNAAEIISFIQNNFKLPIKLIGGVSLGAQISLEILAQSKDICEYALIESAMVKPSELLHSMIKPVYGSCYGLISKKWFSKLQFKSLRIREDLFDEYFKDTALITKQNMISFLEANSIYSIKQALQSSSAKMHILVGQREIGAMRYSAKLLHDKIPDSELKVLKGLYHGEFAINHADEYAEMIKKIFS